MNAPTSQLIADWLEKLGLGQYAQRFIENEATLSTPPDLTDADLKELGVSALGHRRELLRLPGQTASILRHTHNAAWLKIRLNIDATVPGWDSSST